MKKNFIISIFILSLLFLGIPINAHAFVGNNRLLPAQQSTSNNEIDLYSGEATHVIKLQVSPGTNGLTPSLSLVYNSSTVESHRDAAFISGNLFGAGWNIDFPYIYRDTNYTPADTSDDTYKIDWQGVSYKLIDQGNGIFTTNINTFTNITHQTGSPNNASGDYWTVQMTDGTTYRFGYNASSEVACSNRNYPLEWVLDTVTDTHGNNIYYNYVQNPYPNDIGTIYPTSIQYNNDKSRVINFAFSPSDSPTMTGEYFEGCLVRYSRNLTSVTTTANGSQVKKYNLNYTNTITHNLLSSVTELGSDNTSKPSTSFQYNPEAAGWPSTNTPWGNTGFMFSGNNYNVRLADMNGDGLPDLVYADSNGYHVYLNTGSGFNLTPINWGNTGFDFNANNGTLSHPEVYLADMNGDGLPDLVYADSNGYHVYLNTGSGFNLTPINWGNTGFMFSGNNWNVRLADMNGDGLPDLVYADSNGYHVYLNTGSGFDLTAINWGNTGFDFNANNGNEVYLADMNGDGLPDLVYADSNGYHVYLNTGSGFNLTPINWGNTGFMFSGNNYNVRLADMNGDGLADLVYADSNGYHVYLNTGSGFDLTAINWGNTGFDFNANNGNEVYLADMNGDGLTDLAYADSNGFYVYPETISSPYLLSNIHTDTGATISYNYQKSTGTSGTILPFNEWLVSQMTIDNGMTNSQHTSDTTTYTYKNGVFNWPNKEFRGFAEVDETDPNSAKKQTFFDQSDGLKGILYKQIVTDSAGNPYTETDDTWNSSLNNGVYTNTLTSEKKYTYDGSSSNPKTTETDYQYDQYGNVTKESDLGDTSTANDDRYTYKQYTYNTSSYLVDLPYDTYVTGTDGTTKVKETWDYYDNNANLTDTPTKGDLTKEVKWLSGETNPTTSYTYDSFGNKTQDTDANNHSTSYTYDSTGTNVTSTTNAKNQTTSTTYDLGTGNLLSKTDPNGFTTSYTYDPFGRVLTEIDPYDSSSFPTKTYTYYDNSLAPQGKLVSQLEVSGQAGTLDTYTFTDGLGRTIQERKPAEDTSKQIVTDIFYDPNGKISKVSVPHLDAMSTTYVTPDTGIEDSINTYDPIDRLIQVTNPWGTYKTTAYDHWTQTATDENGHQTKKFMDAFNNIIEVDEYNNGSTYTTVYQYDPLNNLTLIDDARNHEYIFYYDTLERKSSETDPDIGQWNYTYDGVGNLLTKTDHRGITTTKTYDVLNRLTQVSYPTDPSVTYTYDGNGKIGTLTSVTDAAGTVNYSYDNRLRKTQEQRVTDGNTWTTSYTYDDANRILNTTYPDNTVVANTYDAQGEVASVSGVMNNIDYNAFGKVTDKTLANGLTTNYTYNTNDFRLDRIQTGTVQDVSYAYDNVGNVKSTTDNLLSKTQTFGYDDLDRLTTASESAGYNYTYSYDPLGNLTSFSSPDTTTTYTYNTVDPPVHAPATVTSDTTIYDDSYAYGWIDASYGGTSPTVETTTVYSGSNALSMAINANGGLDFQAPRFFTTGAYSYLHFALRANQSGQQYNVYADTTFGQALTTPVSLANYGGQPTTSGWTVYNIPLSDLGATNVPLGDIVIQNATSSNEPALYVDQVQLKSGTIPTPTPTTAPTATPTPTPGGPTPALVQKQKGFNGGTGSVSTSFTNNVTSGNTIIVMTITGSASNYDTTSVTDTQNNTYTQIGTSQQTAAGTYIQMWYAKDVTGGAVTVTSHQSGSASGCLMEILEYSGLSTTAPADQSASATGNSTSPSGGSITPTNNNALVISAFTDDNNDNVSITGTNGYTVEESDEINSTSSRNGIEDQVQSTATATSGIWTTGSASSWAAAIVSFKP